MSWESGCGRETRAKGEEFRVPKGKRAQSASHGRLTVTRCVRREKGGASVSSDAR